MCRNEVNYRHIFIFSMNKGMRVWDQRSIKPCSVCPDTFLYIVCIQNFPCVLCFLSLLNARCDIQFEPLIVRKICNKIHTIDKIGSMINQYSLIVWNILVVDIVDIYIYSCDIVNGILAHPEIVITNHTLLNSFAVVSPTYMCTDFLICVRLLNMTLLVSSYKIFVCWGVVNGVFRYRKNGPKIIWICICSGMTSQSLEITVSGQMILYIVFMDDMKRKLTTAS